MEAVIAAFPRWLALLGPMACGEPPEPLPAPEPLVWTSEQGPARAIAADRACATGDPEACWWLGLHRRWATPGDRVGAWAAWSRGCDLGHVQACEAAAIEAPDPAKRRDRYARGCSLGSRSACLGERSIDWACGASCEEACAGGEARACTRQGRDGSGEEASALLWKGCDGDDPWGCLILADRVAAGAPNPSGKTLEWLYTQVCDIQLDYGCVGHPFP